jgi:DNA-binding transcriptional LysR family regulator
MQIFDTVTLRVFLATARLGSIGAAARSEHLATSAASRRISDLENDLDTVLIARTPAGASLTPAGRVFANHCEQLLNKYTNIRADLKRFADGEAGEFRIAAIPWAMSGSLPSIIAHFKETHPSVHLTVQEIFTRDGIRFLREDLADLAIIYDTGDLAGFEVAPFKKDPVWVVGNHEHPLFNAHDGKSPIDFRKTLDYEHISLHEGSVLDELIAEAKRKEGRNPKYNIKLIRFNSLIKCVEAGLGLGIIGEKDLRPHMDKTNLRAAPLSDSWASRDLVFAFSKGQAASPLVSSFLDCFSKIDN